MRRTCSKSKQASQKSLSTFALFLSSSLFVRDKVLFLCVFHSLSVCWFSQFLMHSDRPHTNHIDLLKACENLNCIHNQRSICMISGKQHNSQFSHIHFI